MANGGGGIIVLGIRADQELPKEIIPFELDGFAEDLANVLVTRLEPPPQYELESAELDTKNGLGLGVRGSGSSNPNSVHTRFGFKVTANMHITSV